MKRREFFEKAGIGSAALAASAPGLSPAAGGQAGANRQEEERHDHDDHKDMDGPLSHAVVSFGQWNSEPPIDRLPNGSPRTQNNHQLIPKTVTIKAGSLDEAVDFSTAIHIWTSRKLPGLVIPPGAEHYPEEPPD